MSHPSTRLRIGNVGSVFRTYAKRAGVELFKHPSKDEVDQTLKFAATKGVFIQHPDGRAYPRYQPASPIVNGVRMRWAKGKLVPRVSA